MIVMDAVPRDIHVIVDFSLSSLKNLRTVLDNMTFDYDSTNPEHVEAKEYLEQVLYPTVNGALEKYNDGS